MSETLPEPPELPETPPEPSELPDELPEQGTTPPPPLARLAARVVEEPVPVQVTLYVTTATPTDVVAQQAVAAFEAGKVTDPTPPVPEPPEPEPPEPEPEPGPATGAIAGKPGVWGFSDDGSEFEPSPLAIPPKSPTALRANDPVQVFPFPAERWQPGEYLQTQNQTQSGWAWYDGETWRSGKTPS